MNKLIISSKTALVALLVMITTHASGFTRDDVTDKSKPIWTDFTVDLYHQFVSQTPFSGLNKALCTFNNSEYQNFTNFKVGEDGATSQAYKANLNDNDCSINESNDAYIFRSTQRDSDSPLIIESWLGGLSMDRAKLTVEEEVSDANPFGIMSVVRNIFGSAGVSLYRVSTQSRRLDNSRIQYKMMTWVDGHLITQTTPIGQQSEFYTSNIIYQENNSGYGTVAGLYFFENSPMNFPDGIPIQINSTNLAFNPVFFLYQETVRQASGANWSSAEVCLNRDVSWRYVPNFGYGVYDANGDRFAGGQVTYNNDGVLESMVVGGNGLEVPRACRSLEDGSLATNCDYEYDQSGNPVGIALTGAEMIPAFDVPDGALVTGDDGNEYLVRQLRPRTVYAQVAIENCAGLSLQETLSTPDHTFAVQLDGDVPPTGAMLVNAYEIGDTIGDPSFLGAVYDPDGDADGDGVLNYRDAFPEDAGKSVDADYDGIDDAEDTDVAQTVYQLPDYSELVMQDYPEKGTKEN
jgi:hypothetical protein